MHEYSFEEKETMIKPKHCTTVKVKEKHIEEFFELMKDQLIYGGKKYACNNEKEATDVVVENFGVDWVLGTMMKYLLRYKNLQRERDLLKIASYCYIIWLQMGYHIENEHDKDTYNEKLEEKNKNESKS